MLTPYDLRLLGKASQSESLFMGNTSSESREFIRVATEAFAEADRLEAQEKARAIDKAEDAHYADA